MHASVIIQSLRNFSRIDPLAFAWICKLLCPNYNSQTNSYFKKELQSVWVTISDCSLKYWDIKAAHETSPPNSLQWGDQNSYKLQVIILTSATRGSQIIKNSNHKEHSIISNVAFHPYGIYLIGAKSPISEDRSFAKSSVCPGESKFGNSLYCWKQTQ